MENYFVYLAFLVTTASCFLLISASLGRVIHRTLHVEMHAIPLLICSGITPILVALYYLQGTGTEIWIIYLWIALGLCAFGKEMLIPAIQGSSDIRSTIVEVTITSFFVSIVIAYLSGSLLLEPVTRGNNDLYNWYSVASTFLGKARYSEMHPDAITVYPQYLIDGFGTSWMLAIIGVFFEEPIKSAGLFLVLTGAWLALTLQSQLRAYFDFSLTTAVFLSILPILSSFYLYVTHNAMFAQILGTIGCAVLIQVFIRIYRQKDTSFVNRLWPITISVLWTFCVYQSGFLVFQLIALSFGFFLFLSFDTGDGVKDFILKIATPYCLALVTCAMVLPGVAEYTLARTLGVSTVQAGWALPLIPAHVYMGLPWPEWLPGDIGSSDLGVLTGYLYFAVGIAALLAFCWSRDLRSLASIWVWYTALIITYVSWYFLGASLYQNWKFATFFIYSAAFLPVGTIFLWIRNAFDRTKLEPEGSAVRFSILVAILPLLLVITLVANMPLFKSTTSRMGPVIDEFVQIRSMLKPEMDLSLDLGDYGYSMLAMLVFSRAATTYPIAQTYMQPSYTFGTGAERGLLTSSACDGLFANLGYWNATDEIARTQNFVVKRTEYPTFMGYRFRAPAGPCGWGRDIRLNAGFSGAESWGTWTNGDIAQLTVGLPSTMIGKTVRVSLSLTPYIPVAEYVQRIRISINGEELLSTNLVSQKLISIDVPREIITDNELRLSIELPDAISPHALDADNPDMRRIGIGFLGFGISAI